MHSKIVSSKKESLNFKFDDGSASNIIKFVFVIGFIIIFAFALFSAIGHVDGVKEGVENASKVRKLKHVNR